MRTKLTTDNTDDTDSKPLALTEKISVLSVLSVVNEELKQRWRRAATHAEADKPAIVGQDKRLWAALEEQTLSGELRRVIFESPLNTGEIAERANVPLAAINNFLHGETSLDSEALSRIAQVLDCHLVSSS